MKATLGVAALQVAFTLRQKAFSPHFQASHHLWRTQQRDLATCLSALPPTAAHLMKQRMGQQACLLSRKPQCPHFMDKIMLLDRKRAAHFDVSEELACGTAGSSPRQQVASPGDSGGEDYASESELPSTSQARPITSF